MGPCRGPGLLERLAEAVFLFWSNKKTAPYPTWDKSCTPAIPPKLTLQKTSTRFTRHHACPMDNGWVPVGIYWRRTAPRSSRPRKSIHSAAPRPDPTIQDSLKVCRTGYYSFSQVYLLFGCCGYYIRSFFICQPQFFNSLKKNLGRTPVRPLARPYRAEYPYLSTTASSSCFSLHMGHSSGR